MTGHSPDGRPLREDPTAERGPGMPRWLKIWGTVLLLVLALLVVVGLLGGPGGHGPGRHLSGAGPVADPVTASAPAPEPVAPER